MNEFNNIKNRFDTNQVVRDTVNASSLSAKLRQKIKKKYCSKFRQGS